MHQRSLDQGRLVYFLSQSHSRYGAPHMLLQLAKSVRGIPLHRVWCLELRVGNVADKTFGVFLSCFQSKYASTLRQESNHIFSD
jgi:hypothetical protein